MNTIIRISRRNEQSASECRRARRVGVMQLFLAPVAGMAAFEPFGLWWLMPVACWLLCSGIQAFGPKSAALLAFISATGLYALTLPWLWTLFDVMAVALWMILGGFLAVFAYFTRVGAEQWGHGFGFAVASAFLWTGIEYFRGEVFVLRFPWITPGTALPPGWLTPLVGTYGVTFVVVFASSLIARPNSSRSCRWAALLTVGALAASVLVPRDASERAGTSAVRIAAVQIEGGAFQHHLDQSKSVSGGADIFVWPEHSVPYPLMEQERQLGELQAFLREQRAIAVVGTRRPGVAPEDEADSDRSYWWFNTACVISPDQILGFHDKNHPVHFFNDGIPGRSAAAITLNRFSVGKIGTPICFDVDFQDIVRRMTDDGAEFLLVPTMDSEQWTARQHLQHAQLFRHRSAECGRWMAVAATSGVTQIIDDTGRTRASLPLMREDTLAGDIYPVKKRTVFVRGGWMFGPVCMWLAGGLVIAMVLLRAGFAEAERSCRCLTGQGTVRLVCLFAGWAESSHYGQSPRID